MAEKDITEKMLEAYNDVFTDIINNLILDCGQLVSENELEDAIPISQYYLRLKHFRRRVFFVDG